MLKIVLAGLVMAMAMVANAWAADGQKPLRVAIADNYPPFSIMSPYGEPFGLYVDMWKLWGQTMGVPIKFVSSSWADTLEAVRTGKADVHSGLYRNEQRDEFLDFSIPIHVARNALYFRGDSPQKSLKDLKGIGVGVVEGTYQEQYLKTKYPDVVTVSFSDNDKLIEAVLKGQVAAILSETVSVQAGMARLGLVGALRRGATTLFTNQVYAGVGKRRLELLSKINEGFEKIPREKLAQVEKRWLSDPLDHFYMAHEGEVRLTAAEATWVKQNPRVRVAVTTFINPIDIVDGKGGYSGLNADILTLLEQRTGLTFQPQFFGAWSDVVDNVMAGKVHGAMSFSITEERKKQVLFTKPYAYDPVVIVTRENETEISSPKSLKGKRVSAVKGLAWIEEVEANVGEGKVVLADNESKALALLAQGKVDAHMTSLILYGNAQKQAPVPGLKIASSYDTEGGTLRIGVHKSNAMLYGVLNKAIDSLTNADFSALKEKWLVSDAELDRRVTLTAAERQWIKQHPTIRIAATPDWPPFEEQTAGNGYVGVTSDFIHTVARRVGLNLEVVFDSWDRHLQNLKDKKIDIAPGVFDTPERRTFLLMTEPFVELSDALYVSERTLDIHAMDDLKGRKVAVERSYAMHEVLSKQYPEAKLVVVDTTLEALKAVITGAADAYVGNQPVTNYLIRKHLLTGLRHAAFFNRFGQSLHIGVRNDWPMLHKILQKGLESISPDERRAIFGKWIFGTSEARESVKRLEFSQEEKDWLQDHPVIRVHNEQGWAPFNFNEGGNPRGFSIDYMELLAEKIGVRAEYVSGPEWGVFLDMIRNKAIDVMLNIVKTPERETYIRFTEPYVSNPPVVIARKSSDIKQFSDLRGRKVCFPDGFFYQEIFRQKYPDISLVSAANQENCLKMVSENRADATVGGVAVQAQLISKLFLGNLHAVAGLSDPDIVNDLRIGVRSDWPVFQRILNKAIASVSSEELNRITDRWIKVDVDLSTPQSEEEQPYSLVIGIGLTAFGIVLLVFLLQFVLRRLVKKDASHLYQSKELKTTGLALVILFLGVVVLAAWVTVREAEKDTRAEAGHNLLSVLTTTHETLKAWAGSETNKVRNISRNPGLVSLVEELLLVGRDAKELSDSIELQAIRNWLKVHFGIQEKSPFSIIAPDGLQVAAKDDAGLGRRDVIAEARPGVFKAVIDGEIRFVPPLRVKTEEAGSALTAQFFMAPIKDADGKVIAAFALQSDPKEDFSRITQLGRVGTTGETYAVDEKGRLITASRYDAELRAMGLIGEKSEAMLNLTIRNPGVNLIEGGRAPENLAARPLTEMAVSVTEGQKGMNVDGYRDYRGVPVIGVWLWDKSLNIGLATELDEGEAMAAFRSLRKTMFFILGATVLISLGLMGLSVWIGQSAAVSLTRSRDEAEDARLKAEEARWEAEQAEEQIRMKVAEIERFNRLAMGREERIIELKEMVNGLQEQAGEEPQFKPLEDSGDILDAETGGAEQEEAPLNLTEMINLKELQGLLDYFCNSVGIAAAIIDLKGEVLAAARWQRACTDFHRVNEESCARCIESDTDLALKLQDGEQFSVYKCKNGLTDAASPLIIEGEHLANVFIGQFLLNKPDTDFFKEQAKIFGYDENDYMAAIGEVPVISEERLPNILGFLAGFARLVASLSVERLRAQKIGENQERERAAALNLAEDAEIARAELSDYKDQLEDLVEERTAELQVSEERTRLLLDSVGEGIFGVDLEGKITFVNPAVTEMLGYEPGELIGEQAHPLFHHTRADGSDYPVKECWMYKSFTEGESYRIDNEVLWRKDGSPLDIEYLSTPILRHDKLDGAVITFMDISERKAAQEKLSRSEAQMKEILASSPIGAGITDIKTGEMVFANRKQEELFGVGEGGFRGISAGDVYASLEDRHKILEAIKKDGRVTDWEVKLRRMDGGTFWALLSASEMTYEDRLARLAWFYDITERKEAEQELQQLYEVVSDSIQYASHIQRSVLTGEDMMAATMREHMVLWEPRDVVGGDIYWCHIWGDGVLVVLGDCTGHGVPGAFMTLIATGALDRAMADVPPGQVGNLIQRMHQVIQIMLKQHGDRSESDDGLELGACFLNPDMTKMTFAGARFPLFQLEGGEITEYKGTKKGIGYRGISQTQVYEETEIELRPGTTFYMTSDGYLDQVGGEKRRMFGKKRFKQLLIDMEMLDFEEQKRTLMQALADYQGEETRRDDVSIVAFRI